MKYLQLILMLFIITSCKGQDDNVDLNTTWYEIKKQGNNYSIVDCGYEGEWFKIVNDSIYDHGIMEDSKFKIDRIVRKENSVSLYINKKEEYNITWIDRKRGIIKKTSDLEGNNSKYYVRKSNLNNIKHVKGTNKDCITSEDFNETKKISTNDKLSYSANGTWKLNCEEEVANISIKGKNAFLVVLFNQIYIEMVETKRYDFEKGIAYKLKEIPDDLGTYGIKLDWKEYVNDKPIAYIKIIDDNTINFYWYGFYNKKTNKREMTECQFNQDSNEKDIVLKKCSE
ncbi:hypothetical protein [Chryseobacterium polytrichastri]|uniref:Uncharacterized protein n=1 Tax=Chryseobacterium polytrichastri TaxID=1302687 RepID=A0A1M7JR26_9FLAO|nr:hypothetical protein [Chryseobacterium polytrichastri]SHM55027.1 hypothetical protein SAMN05444267_105410 [Chryseobacterium polytrichastri]